MLLIPDIHITSLYADKIISSIRAFAKNHDDEKNIIFLGDYVYHFTYDRRALLKLFEFFLELYQEGKNIYILSGNHDRIWESFVFHEWKTISHILEKMQWDDGKWKLKFITSLHQERIEEQNIIFLPFSLHYTENPAHTKTNELIEALAISKHKNEIISSKINKILLNSIDPNKEYTIIHHHYINNTVFPWQKSRFNFKDIALSETFLDMQNIFMISWHLHQWFSHKNYLCLGSLRHTSPLETNQIKWLTKIKDRKIDLYQNDINPYIIINQKDDWIQKNDIEYTLEEIFKSNADNFEKITWKEITTHKGKETNYKDISLSIQAEKIDYSNINLYIENELNVQLKDTKIKMKPMDNKKSIEKLEMTKKGNELWFADLTNLLKEYIIRKYPQEHEIYIDTLKKMKLI